MPENDLYLRSTIMKLVNIVQNHNKSPLPCHVLISGLVCLGSFIEYHRCVIFLQIICACSGNRVV